MEPFNPKIRNDPEKQIQNAIIAFLNQRNWFVKSTHGNAYQSGFPDLYAHHKIYGPRWIEVKNPEKYQFTVAQKKFFPLFEKHGAGIWVLTAANNVEYNKLFHAPNWHFYLR